MTTYNLNIANISFNSSLDSRDIQKEIDNIKGLKNDYESDLESLNDEYKRYSEELAELEALKEEIETNSDEGFEYGIQLIHENYIDDYLDELLEACGYIPKDLPLWVKIDWRATYDNMKEEYNEIELNGNTFYVR